MVGKDLCDEIYFHQNAEGNMMSPFECWLALRGLHKVERAAHDDAELLVLTTESNERRVRDAFAAQRSESRERRCHPDR